MTAELCRILEVLNDESDSAVSIAQAIVAQGETTELHRLRGVDERHVIVQRFGIVKVGQIARKNQAPAMLS